LSFGEWGGIKRFRGLELRGHKGKLFEVDKGLFSRGDVTHPSLESMVSEYF